MDHRAPHQSFRPIRHIFIALCLTFGVVGSLIAQISPGELSSAHAALEGISNCTQCHTLGKTISSDRCLACHTEIRSRIAARTGLHGKNSYQQCIDCHKEHHGKDFSMRRLDLKTFDHSLTGYALEGKHAPVECVKCHEPLKIKDVDITSKSTEVKQRTYLGLASDCASCHRDIHRGQLPQQCDQCHTAGGWTPAAKFSHDRSAYKLTGKHAAVACMQCHKKVLDQNTVVQYTHIEFASCSSCHIDPHSGKFNQSCEGCHTTTGWNEGRAKVFDHSLTRFPLNGKHAQVKCGECHTNAAKKGKDGVGAFSIAKFANCSDCHADAHAGQLSHRSDHGRCESCHTESAFIPAKFTVSNHKNTRFDLTGAHLATACTACHQANEIKAKSTRRFRWEGELRCLTCHKDPHGSQFSSDPKKDCEACHTSAAWNSLLFSHEHTRLPLRGRHEVIACIKCHTPIDAGLPTERVRYRALPLLCSSCHKDEHEGQLAKEGATDCARCHTAASWKVENFNHTLLTRYELTGKHTSVSCKKCHIPATINGRQTARYKPLRTACIDCHASGDGHEPK